MSAKTCSRASRSHIPSWSRPAPRGLLVADKGTLRCTRKRWSYLHRPARPPLMIRRAVPIEVTRGLTAMSLQAPRLKCSLIDSYHRVKIQAKLDPTSAPRCQKMIGMESFDQADGSSLLAHIAKLAREVI